MRVYSELAQRNLFTTERNATLSALATLKRSVDFYIWKMSDGLYEWTAIPDPKSPGFPAQLVSRGTTPRVRS
jgi:hypothetical protein